jgi:hypothetical protein
VQKCTAGEALIWELCEATGSEGGMYGVEIYYKVRRAHFVEGESIRELTRMFGIHRKTVRKMLSHSVPPGYQRQQPPARPKLDPFTGIIDQILL